MRKGRKGKGICKGVCVLVGDNSECLEEVRLCMAKKWPVIVLSGSELCNKIKGLKGSEEVDDVRS